MLLSAGFRSSWFRGSLVAVTLGLIACGGEDDPGAGDGTSSSSSSSGGSTSSGSLPPPPPGEGARIRVIHASPDAPAVDVYVKGSTEPVLRGLTYTQSSEYLSVPAGSYEFELRASPSTAASPIAYATGPLALKVGDSFSAIASGLLAGTEDASRFRVLAVHEDFGLAGADSAIVRIVHASADAPSVGIDLHDDNAAAPEIGNIDRFATSDAQGVQMTAGQAMQIGITAGGSRVTAFTTPALPAGAQLLVIATGLLGKKANAADGFGLLAVGETGTVGLIRQNPRVYALHAGADAPAVDLFVGDQELVDNLSFGGLSSPVQVPPGAYTIDFFAAAAGNARPAGAPAASAVTAEIPAGSEVLAVATGLLGGTGAAGSPVFQVTAAIEGFADDTQARLRVVHASPDAPAVDVGILNAEQVVSPVLLPNLTFGTASPAEGVGAGQTSTLPLGVTPTGQNSTVAASFHVPVESTTRAFAVAAGALATSGAQPFRLLVVSTERSPWSVTTVHPQP